MRGLILSSSFPRKRESGSTASRSPWVPLARARRKLAMHRREGCRRRRTMFPKIDLGALERYRVPGKGAAVKLGDIDPRDATALPLDKAAAKKARKADIEALDRLQEVLYAEA